MHTAGGFRKVPWVMARLPALGLHHGRASFKRNGWECLGGIWQERGRRSSLGFKCRELGQNKCHYFKIYFSMQTRTYVGRKTYGPGVGENKIFLRPSLRQPRLCNYWYNPN